MTISVPCADRHRTWRGYEALASPDPLTVRRALFAVGLPPTPPAAFDEAMYAPATPLQVATARTAVNTASSAGVLSTGGTGTGLLLRSIRNN